MALYIVGNPPQPQPPSLIWPGHNPAFVSSLPRHGGYGLDSYGGSGRHLLGSPVTKVIVDTPGSANSGSARPELGANVFSGTAAYACRHQGVAVGNNRSAKQIIWAMSGEVRLNASLPLRQGTPGPELSNIDFWGQFAPPPGFYFRNTKPFWNGSSHCRLWHMRSMMGDDTGGLGVENRDCFGSGATGIVPTHVLMINCEHSNGVDELTDYINPHDTCSFIYNAWLNPLHAPPNYPHVGDPPGTDHGFGIEVGGAPDAPQPDGLAFFRNMFGNITGRQVATTARRVVYANNLVYNPGRLGGGAGEGLIFWRQFTTDPIVANVLSNMFIRGPDNNSSLVAVSAQSGIPAGSGCYFRGNVQHGWSAASQAAFCTSAPAGFVSSQLENIAMPSSWGGLAGVLDIAEDPLNATIAEKLAYVELIGSAVGAQPAYRTLTMGRVEKVLNQIRARLAGGSLISHFANTVLEDGGWPSSFTPTIVVDPRDPGPYWCRPMPTGPDVDTPLGAGFFENGLSAVGYTPMEVWALDQHLYVGGIF